MTLETFISTMIHFFSERFALQSLKTCLVVLMTPQFNLKFPEKFDA